LIAERYAVIGKVGRYVTTQERIIQAVFDAVDEVNGQLPAERRVPKSLDAVLYGGPGGLDSLGLVNIIVAVEERIEEFGGPIALADEKAMSQKHSPFATIGSLVDYVSKLVERCSSE
jgi:acyl carrier protein